jgi:TetR/AcrR family transcriptional regulator
MPPAAQAPRPDDASTRERILEAALHCFSELGFDGATTREIARRAGVNLGLIKYYFDGKERLWREAVTRSFDELRDGLAEALRDAGGFDDRERLRLLMRRYIRWVALHPEFIRLMHDEGKRESPRMRWLVDRHVRPLYETTVAALCSAQELGVLPAGIEPLHFHYILIGAVALVFHQAPECRRLTGREPSEDAFIEAHADAVTHLFLGPPSEETPA